MVTYLSASLHRCYNKKCKFSKEASHLPKLANGEQPRVCMNKSKYKGSEDGFRCWSHYGYKLECKNRVTRERTLTKNQEHRRLRELLRRGMEEKYDAIAELPLEEQIKELSKCKTSLFYKKED